MMAHEPAAAPATTAQQTWHTLAIDTAFATLGSRREGLTNAEVRQRLARFGANTLPAADSRPAWRLLTGQFRNLLIAILLVAAVLSAFLGSVLEAIAIIAIALLAILLGFVQEYRAERAIDALREMTAPAAVVVRDGRERTISSRELVPGDILLLQAGRRIAADARVVEHHNLETDEAPLTGESMSVPKRSTTLADAAAPIADRANMVYAGSTVNRGRGVAVVVATGERTEFGRIAGLMQGIRTGRTPLQHSLDRVGRVLAAAAAAIVLAIVVAGLGRGEPVVSMLVFGIALAVAAVPEALPAVVTISLALGVRRMVRHDALVRHLPSVETLGSTSVICADKTGTLTCDEMTVREIRLADGVVEVTGSGWEPRGELRWGDGERQSSDTLAAALRAAVLCSDATLQEDEETGAWEPAGDPTEAALVVAAAKAGIEARELRESMPRTDELPFESERKYMLTRHRAPDGSTLVCCKGAPEVVLDLCDRRMGRDGPQPMDAAAREAQLQVAHGMAAQALRVIAVAQSAGETDFSGPRLVFVGLFGMMDPPRAETREAIARCLSAGIRPVMITGDHPVTAAAVAREIGLVQGGRTLTGVELDALSEAQLHDAVTGIDVYARVSPEHKLRVIDAWQRHGHIVAMTGDGVNDAPALKKADIGVAMGITGTDVAREAAEMTLLDDNFDSIVCAIEEGRAIFNNIRKYLMYLLSSNIGEIGVMAAATLAGLPLPLSAVQILFVNLVTDGPPALALAVDPHDDDLMQRRPRDPGVGIFTRRVVILTLTGGLWSTLVNVTLFTGLLAAGRPLKQAMTMTFVSLVLIQFLKAYSFRTVDTAITRAPFANRWLNLAIVAELALLAIIVYTPVLQTPFTTYALSPGDWALVTVLAVTVLPVLELAKRARHQADAA